jgi:EAL domain-containing protein (putative c-di-GMP-specific phosphodiesterase class I)
MSAVVLTQLVRSSGTEHLLRLIGDPGVVPRLLVLEITEHERIEDMDDSGHRGCRSPRRGCLPGARRLW